MKLLIQDVAQEWSLCENKADKVIFADGRYAPCQGCFACWTKHPAVCRMKDSLYEISRIIGQADELVLVTENTYGGYSQNMENFCLRSGLNWFGGLGIGGGVMMNVMRIMVMTLFGCGIISFDVWLAACINRKRTYGKHYTRVMVPSFVFILFADMFFFLLSLFSGGLFKGWTKS